MTIGHALARRDAWEGFSVMWAEKKGRMRKKGSIVVAVDVVRRGVDNGVVS